MCSSGWKEDACAPPSRVAKQPGPAPKARAPTRTAGPKVLAETSKDRTSDRFPLAILGGLEARDVAVSVRFKPVSGTVDQAAGLVARLRDPRSGEIIDEAVVQDGYMSALTDGFGQDGQ